MSLGRNQTVHMHWRLILNWYGGSTYRLPLDEGAVGDVVLLETGHPILVANSQRTRLQWIRSVAHIRGPTGPRQRLLCASLPLRLHLSKTLDTDRPRIPLVLPRGVAWVW